MIKVLTHKCLSVTQLTKILFSFPTPTLLLEGSWEIVGTEEQQIFSQQDFNGKIQSCKVGRNHY